MDQRITDADSPDSTRTYTAEEKLSLTEHLQALYRALEAGAFSEHHLDLGLLQHFHRVIFSGVRGHAGKHRNARFGQERLNFGPHRSSHRNDVERELTDLFAKVRRGIAELCDDPDRDDYEYHAIRAAVWAHAEIVRIHPFEDGNGRASRVVQDYILVKLGLVPIPIEAVKTEYLGAMDFYIGRRDPTVLFDLYLRLADGAEDSA